MLTELQIIPILKWLILAVYLSIKPIYSIFRMMYMQK